MSYSSLVEKEVPNVTYGKIYLTKIRMVLGKMVIIWLINCSFVLQVPRLAAPLSSQNLESLVCEIYKIKALFTISIMRVTFNYFLSKRKSTWKQSAVKSASLTFLLHAEMKLHLLTLLGEISLSTITCTFLNWLVVQHLPF